MTSIRDDATLTYPASGARHWGTMADSSFQFFYRCDACGATLEDRGQGKGIR